jgi:hypothetical protein
MTQMQVEPACPDLAGALRLRPLELGELFALDIKPRGMVLDPIIPEKGLAMLYGMRGTGKTHVALGIAYAVATGSTFLRWQAPRPGRVLLIDGEMPAQARHRPRRSGSSPATWSTTASATWRSRRCRPSSTPGSTASSCSSSTTSRA